MLVVIVIAIVSNSGISYDCLLDNLVHLPRSGPAPQTTPLHGGCTVPLPCALHFNPRASPGRSSWSRGSIIDYCLRIGILVTTRTI
jgi:hypothetical protein